MAVHASHSALPFPVKNARFSFLIPYLASDGVPTVPTTPDTEVSKDNGAAADCTEEVSPTSGMGGMALMTLTGAEMNASCVAVMAKVASGPTFTPLVFYPQVLPVILNGTATAGGAASITLEAGPTVDNMLCGCIVRTTGGTGGGGTGGANNQARVIVAYNGTTKACTVEPAWETAVDATTDYDVLLSPLASGNPSATTAASLATTIAAITMAEATAAPAVNAPWPEQLAWVVAVLTNHQTRTSTLATVRNRANSASIATADLTVGATLVRGSFE